MYSSFVENCSKKKEVMKQGQIKLKDNAAARKQFAKL
jgi:uncharacterized membrane protein